MSTNGRNINLGDNAQYIENADSVTQYNIHVHTLQNEASFKVKPSSHKTTLSELTNKLLKQSQNRRTAYPTDMSFYEIYNKKVYIEPTFKDLIFQNVDFPSVFNNLYYNRHSILVIGNPGTGKSFFAFLFQQKSVELKDSTQICLPVDLRIFENDIHKKSLALNNLLIKLFQANGFNNDIIDIDYSNSNFIFVIDGLDELINNKGIAISEKLFSFLENLKKFGSLIVTCRTLDFEKVVSSSIDTSIFDHILTINAWELEKEFYNYICKLKDAGLLDDFSDLYSMIKKSENLSTLIQRPLHARMITYLNGSNLKKIESLSELYFEYLSKYSKIVNLQISRTCDALIAINCYLIWQKISWFVFLKDLFIYDKIPLNSLISILKYELNEKEEYNTKLLYPLFNYFNFFNTIQLQYIHYSFYEYYVAEYIATKLIESFYNNNHNIYELLSKRITPEIGHHLTAILNKIKPKGFGKWLVQSYDMINTYAPDYYQRIISVEVMLYIAGRINEDVEKELRHILEFEKDSFLIRSIYWSMSSINNGIYAATQYINSIFDNEELRSLNRGKHLYYYNDISKDTLPPYYDNENITWNNTKKRMLNMMTQSTYITSIPVGRRVLDLFTYLDLCIKKGEIESKEDYVLINNIMININLEIPQNLASMLNSMFSKILVN